MEELTRTEERVMQAIWELDTPFFIKDLVERMPGKPPYNTILSVVRILESKGLRSYVRILRQNSQGRLPEKWVSQTAQRLLRWFYHELTFFHGQGRTDHVGAAGAAETIDRSQKSSVGWDTSKTGKPLPDGVVKTEVLH